MCDVDGEQANAKFVRFTFPAVGQFSPFRVAQPPLTTNTPSVVQPPASASDQRAQADVDPPATQQVGGTQSLSATATLPATPTIARIHISMLTPELFDRRFRSVGVPLIIEGALDIGSQWRLQAFVGLFPEDVTYGCRIHGGDSFATSPDMWRGKSHARHVVQTSPAKFADTIATGIAAREDCYVQADVQGTRAGQVIAVQFDRIAAATGLRVHQLYGTMANMWWGPPGHTEPLHMDVTDGTLCQLRGRKRIILFPPSCWRDLYPFPADPKAMSWAFSRVVQSQPDFARFPKLRQALKRRVEVVLNEGEVRRASPAPVIRSLALHSARLAQSPDCTAWHASPSCAPLARLLSMHALRPWLWPMICAAQALCRLQQGVVRPSLMPLSPNASCACPLRRCCSYQHAARMRSAANTLWRTARPRSMSCPSIASGGPAQIWCDPTCRPMHSNHTMKASPLIESLVSKGDVADAPPRKWYRQA